MLVENGKLTIKSTMDIRKGLRQHIAKHKIVEIGRNDELVNVPRHPYTEWMISAITEPDPTLDFRPQVLEGEMVNLINRPSGCVFCGRCPVAEKICSEVEPALDEKADGRSVACHLR